MSDESTCPVCGEPYDHSILVGNVRQAEFSSMPEFRSDVAVCKTGDGVVQSAYVHHKRKQEVRAVRSNDRSHNQSPIQQLFGWNDTEVQEE